MNAPSGDSPSLARWQERPEIAAALPSLRALPSMPESHRRVLSALNDSQYIASRVAQLISEDVTLTAQLLKVVNSSLFGLAQRISSVEEAIPVIGATRLRALVASAWAFHFIDEAKACPGFNPWQEWDHALQVGMETQQLAMSVHCANELGQAAFTAGILHDLGKILLAVNTPERYAKVAEEAKSSGQPQWEVELKVLGFHHGEIAACLLGTWGIAAPIVEAVGWHHQPGSVPGQGLSVLTFVHVADCNVRGLQPHAHCMEIMKANARSKSFAELRATKPS
jgi:HD-like signal output (HDOD) protein